MARRDALRPLHETLLARGADLRKKLAGELADLRDFKAADSTGDSVDVAFETCSGELSAQFAELDACELIQALARLTQGEYGLCEGGGENCQKRNPAARLRALPYATLCINCEREVEKFPKSLDWLDAFQRQPSFGSDTFVEGRRITLSQLERELTSNRGG